MLAGYVRLPLTLLKDWLLKNMDEIKRFVNFSSLYSGLMDKDGCSNMYNVKLRIMGSNRELLAEFDRSADYLELIGEHVEP
ncbi:MAG: hypothetical protein SWO11_23725 [Thermodesulfobacteriota bacterium]|nr:hypothetical protein [Thermodesulfobacteriota bacterium]